MPDISHLATKAVLNTTASKIENKIPNTSTFLLVLNQRDLKNKTFDLGLVLGKSHFEDDGTQNYLYNIKYS